jgi:hypothetical protein
VNWGGALLTGLFATVVMTTIMAGSQALRLTRMNIPFMVGATFTPDRDLARIIGIGVHLLNGWWIALIYAGLFQAWGIASWWLGALLGLVHALAVLLVIIPASPGLHRRMASEQRGPTPTRQLEPPGFMALNYGRRTPISIIVAHIVYGAIMGGLYRLA